MTPALCRLCGVRLDPAAGATHPGCDPGPPVDEATHDALVSVVCAQTGARPIEPSDDQEPSR